MAPFPSSVVDGRRRHLRRAPLAPPAFRRAPRCGAAFPFRFVECESVFWIHGSAVLASGSAPSTSISSVPSTYSSSSATTPAAAARSARSSAET